jgi:PAT family beta-lactamase induction signal transducer AmpG
MSDNTKPKILDILMALKTKRMLVVTLLGFSSGLPIMLVYSSIKLWLTRAGVDVKTLGYFTWIALPYSYNFLWAFLFDRYQPFKMGRRKSWLLLTQLGLLLSLILLSMGNPSESVAFIAIAGGILCFWSASQDVAVDAYRNEILNADELGVGASLAVYGYRIGMWVASGFGIWITDAKTWNWSFQQMFLLMACLMAIGIVTTLFADEPKETEKPLKSLKDSVVLPFMEFMKRDGAVLFLLFIFFFKFGDSFAGSMSRPFYAKIGFDNKTIGEIASTVGLFSSLFGLFVGGSIIYRFGYYAALWVSGILQAISTALFAMLAFMPTKIFFTGVVFFEDLTSGMGTAALVAFMGRLTNKRFTATQYALFASLASLGRTLFAGFAGNVIDAFSKISLLSSRVNFQGYMVFYFISAIMAVPGLFILYRLNKRSLV